MRPTDPSGFLALALVLCCGTVALAGDPFDIDLVLNPGDVEEIECTVALCDTVTPKADIYLMADTTQSMHRILQAVQDTADELIDTLLATEGVDVRIGVGNYRDFPLDEFAFQHQQAITDDADAVKAALFDWFADNGGDKVEGQFYALTKIARDPAIGFREGTDVKRIVVWFGDSPAHDPVCEEIHQDPEIPFDITEETVTEDLLNAGEGGTTVIAISTRIEIPGALDADPTQFVENYEGICEIGGEEGQATRITDATDGIHILELPEPEEITPAILEAVETVLRRVDVTLEVEGAIEPFVQSIEPAMFEDVVVPACIDGLVELTFVVTLEGGNCIENRSEFEGLIRTFVDEEPFEAKTVRITQPACEEAVCFLVIGAKRAEVPVSGDPRDVLLLKPKRPKTEWIIPVTMETVPSFRIPDDPRLDGKHVYMQIYMNNPIDFPGDPIQVSNGLDITIGSSELPASYGPENTIELRGTTTAPLGGELELEFTIEGL